MLLDERREVFSEARRGDKWTHRKKEEDEDKGQKCGDDGEKWKRNGEEELNERTGKCPYAYMYIPSLQRFGCDLQGS
jgi:hypothetical protein